MRAIFSRRFGQVIAFGLLLAWPIAAQTTTNSPQNSTQPVTAPKPGEATGQKIGTAISAAISTAFPEVQKIIDLIWPTNKNQPVKAAAATTALSQPKAQANLQQTQALASLTQIADELAVMRTFLSYCVVADENVTAIQTILEKPTLSPEIG